MASTPVRFLIGLVAGLAVGLGYAWLIQPVTYYDVAPDSLRQDYRADYILMVAQAYQADDDLRLALLRLAALGPRPPVDLVNEAAEYAEAQAFAAADVVALRSLEAGLARIAGSAQGDDP